MDQRIVEILMYVIGEIQSRRIDIDEIDGISDDLMQRGFSQREVATAFSLVASRLGRDRDRSQLSQPLGEHSHRVLHDVERIFVAPEAYGHLLQMVHLGVLSYLDVEALLERCLLMGNLNIGEEEMKMLVASHLLENDSFQGEQGNTVTTVRPAPEHIH
jgi:uncharacterized protein Smg (DUF494 family)